jgi:hypothetical protein
MRSFLTIVVAAGAALAFAVSLTASAGQAPFAAGVPDVPISHSDRVYAAEQYSNTVSVTDPVDNRLLGVIRLGGPSPSSLSPLYSVRRSRSARGVLYARWE